MEKMKAAILVEQHKPLIIDEVTLPAHLTYGQVLVKIHYSGICGSQLGEIQGVKGPDKYLPHLLGHEGGGIVKEVGPGVSRVKIGDHVVLHWRKSAGIESATPKYKWGSKTVNAGSVTTFNESVIVSENRITVIPQDIDLKIAALFGCAVTTAIGVINNDARLKVGESVVIFGVGGVGLNIAQAASLVSGYPIVGVDLSDEKLEFGKQYGLTHTLNAREPDLNNKIKDIVGLQGADVVIDTTGNVKVIEQAYRLTNGRTILVGVPKLDEHISIYSLPLHFNKILKGSHGGGAIPDEDIPRYLKLLKLGKIKLNELISQIISLTEINNAVELMKSGNMTGRIIIDVRN